MGTKERIYFKKALKRFGKVRHYMVYESSQLNWSHPNPLFLKEPPIATEIFGEKKKGK